MPGRIKSQYQKIKTKKQYVSYYQNHQKAKTYLQNELGGVNPLVTQTETETVLEFAKKYLPLKKTRYLDLATGSGRIIRELEKYFGQSFGIDSSKPMLEAAQIRVNRAKFRLADMENLPFKDNSFDLMTGFRFMINLPKKNRLSILEEAFRVLKNKGLFALNIHLNKFSPRGLRDIILGNRAPSKLLSYFEIKKELEKAGFSVLAVQGVNLVILFRFFSFLPHQWLVRIDKLLGRLPLINYFSDTFIVFAQKKS